MKPGDVILTPMPQADGQEKPRPAIVLAIMRPFGDLFVCGLSTQLRHEVQGFDEQLSPGHADFKASGLKAPSLIRLGYAFVVMPDDVLCRVGAVSRDRLTRLQKRLGEFLIEQAASIS
jgi:mRNA interferase MazF